MNMGSIKLTLGVATLMSYATEPIPKGAICFKGDLNQMAEAIEVAHFIGVEAGMGGGYSFVYTQEDYEKVIDRIIKDRIPGYWLYK